MRAQALTIPRALMLFSALLMAIIIVRMVSYHYTVSQRQDNMFRFMLKATDISKKIAYSGDCLSKPDFSSLGVLDIEKLNLFAAKYNDTEPDCAYDYNLGWRATVTERSFVYFSPILYTQLEFQPGDAFNASRITLFTSGAMNVTVFNTTSPNLIEVEDMREFPWDGYANITSAEPVWAMTSNYKAGVPRSAASIGVVGNFSALCADPAMAEFRSIDKLELHDLTNQTLSKYDGVLIVNVTGSQLSDKEDLLKEYVESHGLIVANPEFNFLGFPRGFTSGCENCTTGVLFNDTVPTDLAGSLDLVRGKTPGDLFSAYGTRIRLLVPEKIWVISPYGAQVDIDDLSDGDDSLRLRLGPGESSYYSQFDSDLVSVKSTRPVWIIAGEEGGMAWLAGSRLRFPSFGNVTIVAEESLKFNVSITDLGKYSGGTNATTFSGSMYEGQQLKLNVTNSGGFRWIDVNTTGRVIILTYSDHGGIQRMSDETDEGYQLRTASVGNVTVCAGDAPVNAGAVLPHQCARVSTSFFRSSSPFFIIQELGGDSASLIMTGKESNDKQACELADQLGLGIADQDSSLEPYNLIYFYQAPPKFTLPKRPVGVVLLRNSPALFKQFGVAAQPTEEGSVNWTLAGDLFTSPNNVTDEQLYGTRYYHTLTRALDSQLYGLYAWALSPEQEPVVISGAYRGMYPVVASSIDSSGQLPLLQNFADFVGSRIFVTSTNQSSWSFGASEFSLPGSKSQEITLQEPVSIWHNTTDIRPGVMSVRLVDGELERVAGLVERVCVDGITQYLETRVSSPITAFNGTICQTGCRKLRCSKVVGVDLKPGLRIVKVSANETAVLAT